MNRLRRQCRCKVPALIALALVLVCATAAAQAQAPATEAQPDQMRALPWLKLEDLSATRDRPLFAQSRRPPAPPPAIAVPAVTSRQEEEAPDPRPSLSLRGIIRQDSATLVVLEDNDTSESVVVRSGDSYGRWRVTAISDDAVKLADGTDELRLELFPR
jgi:hypothetical protein